MSVTTTITASAADPKVGMTFGELAAMVDRAAHAGAEPGDRVKVVANLRGGVKTLKVEVSDPIGGGRDGQR
jgi:hypothetical protein